MCLYVFSLETYVFYNVKRYNQHNLMYIFIIITSTPPNAEIDEPLTFDAFDPHDFEGDAFPPYFQAFIGLFHLSISSDSNGDGSANNGICFTKDLTAKQEIILILSLIYKLK